jgi:energy-coupling factor transporter ATP-binding protein EcfA2
MSSQQGNLLGGPRAEVDSRMLEKAFVQTHDFQALVNTNDFNFVVGRRGTGKSALFQKVTEFIKNNKIGYVYSESATEYEALELQVTLNKISDRYSVIRAITRVAWRISLLLGLLYKVRDHYKFDSCESCEYLCNLYDKVKHLWDYGCYKRTCEIVKMFKQNDASGEEIPGLIATYFEIERLHKSIAEVLRTLNRTVYFLFDGLDEGWKPSESYTAIIGGLSSCAADFLEKQCGVHVVLFIRDNIFRSLNYFDRDFSRHIEGNTLRLNWDDASLLNLIANRLRIALNLESIESDIKVWNRFAYADLKNRNGFNSCLNYTLYRPRDLIVLLNIAFIQSARSGRKQLVKSDIETSSKQISKDRLNDLLKEYDVVFPGLHLLVDEFKGNPAFIHFTQIIEQLDDAIENRQFLLDVESDFALMGAGKEAFYALYSVGFLGLENPANKNIQFCHDGSQANIDALDSEQLVCVHPCYWKALDIQSDMIEENVLIEIYDDHKPPDQDNARDIRTKMIGQLISQLPSMPVGKEHATDFENWVFRSIKILFSGALSNPELKPNKDSIQRRDVVATNMADFGFWERVRNDYKSRQTIFEVKNYATLKIEDFRQALSYTGEQYGSFVTIVNRNENEGLSPIERGYVKEFWDQHKVLIFVLNATILSRCISKLRSRQRFDYAENQLNKRLDTFIRSYLSLRHLPKKKRKK